MDDHLKRDFFNLIKGCDWKNQSIQEIFGLSRGAAKDQTLRDVSTAIQNHLSVSILSDHYNHFDDKKNRPVGNFDYVLPNGETDEFKELKLFFRSDYHFFDMEEDEFHLRDQLARLRSSNSPDSSITAIDRFCTDVESFFDSVLGNQISKHIEGSISNTDSTYILKSTQMNENLNSGGANTAGAQTQLLLVDQKGVDSSLQGQGDKKKRKYVRKTSSNNSNQPSTDLPRNTSFSRDLDSLGNGVEDTVEYLDPTSLDPREPGASTAVGVSSESEVTAVGSSLPRLLDRSRPGPKPGGSRGRGKGRVQDRAVRNPGQPLEALRSLLGGLEGLGLVALSRIERLLRTIENHQGPYPHSKGLQPRDISEGTFAGSEGGSPEVRWVVRELVESVVRRCGGDAEEGLSPETALVSILAEESRDREKPVSRAAHALAMEVLSVGKEVVGALDASWQDCTNRALERLRKRWSDGSNLRSLVESAVEGILVPRVVLEDVPRVADLIKNPFARSNAFPDGEDWSWMYGPRSDAISAAEGNGAYGVAAKSPVLKSENLSPETESSIRRTQAALELGQNAILVDASNEQRARIVGNLFQRWLGSPSPGSGGRKAATRSSPWGPVLVVVKVGQVVMWEEVLEACLNSGEKNLQFTPYYGPSDYLSTVRQYWNEDGLFGERAHSHVILTHYETFVADLDYFRTLPWFTLVLDEPWGLLSNKAFADLSLRIQTVPCRHRLFSCSTIVHPKSGCLPDAVEVVIALVPYIWRLFVKEHPSSAAQLREILASEMSDRLLHQLARLVMTLTVFSGNPVYPKLGRRDGCENDTHDSQVDEEDLDYVPCLQWIGVSAARCESVSEFRDSNTARFSFESPLYSSEYTDEELSLELSLVQKAAMERRPELAEEEGKSTKKRRGRKPGTIVTKRPKENQSSAEAHLGHLNLDGAQSDQAMMGLDAEAEEVGSSVSPAKDERGERGDEEARSDAADSGDIVVRNEAGNIIVAFVSDAEDQSMRAPSNFKRQAPNEDKPSSLVLAGGGSSVIVEKTVVNKGYEVIGSELGFRRRASPVVVPDGRNNNCGNPSMGTTENPESDARRRPGGVSAVGDRWLAEVAVRGKCLSVGTYSSRRQAEVAYETALTQLPLRNEILKKRSAAAVEGRGSRGRPKELGLTDMLDTVLMMDDFSLTEVIRMMLAPELFTGVDIASYNTADPPPASYAMLCGPSFSSPLVGTRAVLGRARAPTLELARKLGYPDISGLRVGAHHIHLADHPSIKRQHAELAWDQSMRRFDIACLDDTAGMFIGGRKFTSHSGRIPLRHGSVIQIGCKIFYFLLPKTPARGHEIQDPPSQMQQLLQGMKVGIELRSLREGDPNEISLTGRLKQLQSATISAKFYPPLPSTISRAVVKSQSSNLAAKLQQLQAQGAPLFHNPPPRQPPVSSTAPIAHLSESGVVCEDPSNKVKRRKSKESQAASARSSGTGQLQLDLMKSANEGVVDRVCHRAGQSQNRAQLTLTTSPPSSPSRKPASSKVTDGSINAGDMEHSSASDSDNDSFGDDSDSEEGDEGDFSVFLGTSGAHLKPPIRSDTAVMLPQTGLWRSTAGVTTLSNISSSGTSNSASQKSLPPAKRPYKRKSVAAAEREEPLEAEQVKKRATKGDLRVPSVSLADARHHAQSRPPSSSPGILVSQSPRANSESLDNIHTPSSNPLVSSTAGGVFRSSLSEELRREGLVAAAAAVGAAGSTESDEEHPYFKNARMQEHSRLQAALAAYHHQTGTPQLPQNSLRRIPPVSQPSSQPQQLGQMAASLQQRQDQDQGDKQTSIHQKQQHQQQQHGRVHHLEHPHYGGPNAVPPATAAVSHGMSHPREMGSGPSLYDQDLRHRLQTQHLQSQRTSPTQRLPNDWQSQAYLHQLQRMRQAQLLEQQEQHHILAQMQQQMLPLSGATTAASFSEQQRQQLFMLQQPQIAHYSVYPPGFNPAQPQPHTPSQPFGRPSGTGPAQQPQSSLYSDFSRREDRSQDSEEDRGS